MQVSGVSRWRAIRLSPAGSQAGTVADCVSSDPSYRKGRVRIILLWYFRAD